MRLLNSYVRMDGVSEVRYRIQFRGTSVVAYRSDDEDVLLGNYVLP